MRRISAFFLFCSALFVACSSGTTTAPPVPIASSTPTRAIVRQPVVMAISARQSGSVEAKDLTLEVKVAITNNTSATISIVGSVCFWRVPLLLYLYDPAGTSVWNSIRALTGCPLEPFLDVLAIQSGGTSVWSESDVIFDGIPRDVQANVPYTLSAHLGFWHQGDISQVDKPGVPQGDDVYAHMSITFS